MNLFLAFLDKVSFIGLTPDRARRVKVVVN